MDASAEFLLIKESSQGEHVGAGDHPHLRRVRTLKSPIRTGTIGRLSNSLLDTSSFSPNPAFHFGLLLGEGDTWYLFSPFSKYFLSDFNTPSTVLGTGTTGNKWNSHSNGRWVGWWKTWRQHEEVPPAVSPWLRWHTIILVNNHEKVVFKTIRCSLDSLRGCTSTLD